MLKVLSFLIALCAAWSLTACATAEVTGVRASATVSTVALTSVDVIFLDRPEMQPTGLAALRPDGAWGASATALHDVQRAMSEMREKVESALTANNVPGRSYLLSHRSQVDLAASHIVVVSMHSAKVHSGYPTKITLNVQVRERATQRTLWDGTSELTPGGAGFSTDIRKQALMEKQEKFGAGIVRALRESGVVARAPNKLAVQ